MGSKSLLLPFIAVLALGCGDDARRKLESAQQLWLATRPASYETVVRRSCFCPDVDPYRVQVQGSSVISAVRLNPDGIETTLNPIAYQSWFTVEGLFSAVRSALEANVDHLDARYDPTFGDPLHIDIDPVARAADDETSYEVARLDALP